MMMKTSHLIDALQICIKKGADWGISASVIYH
jgi:hypothetical protein